jgi:molybdenum cofactor guanylyltransferase
MLVQNLLMIGAAGRNVGKTEFACELIRRYRDEAFVVGLKVTTVDERTGSCPRGGEGCGVCGSLQGEYCVTEELSVEGTKDTMRMKRAGAQRVLWLRVRREHLERGLASVLGQIPDRACIVCESNSARHVLEPGGFLVIREAGASQFKDTCRAVLDRADRVVTYAANGWDFEPARCRFSDGRWSVPALATGVVLAGGASRRMGRDKSLLEVGGRTLLEHVAAQVSLAVDEVLVSANDPERYAFAGLRVVPDERPGEGPLMGIYSCLLAARHDRMLVAACDIPELPLSFLQSMLRLAARADIVAPRDAAGRLHPVLAVYRRSIAPMARAVLARGERRVAALCSEAGLRTDYVSLPEGSWYRNLNTPADYERMSDPC